MSDRELPLPDQDRGRQRQAIAWGSGAFLGIGIGGAVGFSLNDALLGLGLGLAIMFVTAAIYLLAGYALAERHAGHIAARDEQRDNEDEGGYEEP